MIAITGATGRLGHALALALHGRGLAAGIRLTTRDPAGAQDLAALGFQVVAADFTSPASLDAAFSGVDKLFMISATGATPVRIPLHRNAIDAAVRAGVRHVVYTSRVNPTSRSPYSFAAIHEDSEARIRASGLVWTFLRNNEFSENLDPWLEEARRTGVLEYGAKGPIAFVCRQDVIDASIAALTGSGHEGQIYELSGPEALDRDQIAAVLSQACGRAIRSSGGSAEDFSAVMAAQGRPDFIVALAAGIYRASEAGEWARPSADPERLIGRAPHSLSSYIRDKFGGPA
jgi:NAD(P)H dehydrogenase (quinone)